MLKVQRTVQIPEDLDKAQVQHRFLKLNHVSFNRFVLDLIRKAVGGKKS